MTGPGPQQNFTTPVSPLVVASARSRMETKSRTSSASALQSPLRTDQLLGLARFRCGDSVGGLTATSAEAIRGSFGFGLNPLCELETSGSNSVWTGRAVGELESETLGTETASPSRT